MVEIIKKSGTLATWLFCEVLLKFNRHVEL